jgi:hypothetical protein
MSKLQSGLKETNTKIQLVVAVLGNPPMSLSVGGSLTIGDSPGQIRFDMAGLKESMDGGLQGMEDLKQIKKHTLRDLLGLALNFDDLAESKSKIVALEQGSKNVGTNGSSREGVGRRNVRRDNLTLDSPMVLGSSLEDRLSGLRTWVSDLKHGGTMTQNSHEFRRMNEELKAL